MYAAKMVEILLSAYQVLNVLCNQLK